MSECNPIFWFDQIAEQMRGMSVLDKYDYLFSENGLGNNFYFIIESFASFPLLTGSVVVIIIIIAECMYLLIFTAKLNYYIQKTTRLNGGLN